MLETYVVYIIKFAALTLVALRISWFLIEDEVPFGPIRVRLNVWATRRSWPRLALFLVCPWCIGLWSQIALVSVVAQFADIPWPGLWPLALNAVVAPAHHLLDQAIRK